MINDIPEEDMDQLSNEWWDIVEKYGPSQVQLFVAAFAVIKVCLEGTDPGVGRDGMLYLLHRTLTEEQGLEH